MKIVTAVVNNPTFIEIQYYTFKQYVKGVYEFIVFNDAKSFPDFTNGGNIFLKQEIERTCKKLGIKCINIPNDHHASNTNRLAKEPSYRTAESMNFILEYQKRNPDYYLLVDSDMFLLDFLDIDYYKQFDAAVILQKRYGLDKQPIHYIWNGFYYFNIPNLNTDLMNWHCSFTTDTGGMMCNWLKTVVSEIPDVSKMKSMNSVDEQIICDNILFCQYLCSLEWNEAQLPDNLKKNVKLLEFFRNDDRNVNGQFHCEIYHGKFLHYRGGGNWEKTDYDKHVSRSDELKKCILNE
uniref:Nucleotide-diphospho-sugar transferase domain-containing protein n=1 Tax=viral metagenome TaxID=1070528 RepID=A0A6C0LM09_9ZZZZ